MVLVLEIYALSRLVSALSPAIRSMGSGPAGVDISPAMQ